MINCPKCGKEMKQTLVTSPKYKKNSKGKKIHDARGYIRKRYYCRNCDLAFIQKIADKKFRLGLEKRSHRRFKDYKQTKMW